MLNLEKSGLKWAELELQHPKHPSMDFSGDDDVEISYSRSMVADPKNMGLPLVTTRGVLKVAQNYGADVDRPTFERVKRMAFAPEAGDVWLDEPNIDTEERERRHKVGATAVLDAFNPKGQILSKDTLALAHEQPELYGAIRYWGNSVRSMPEVSRERVQQHALGCIGLSLEKSRAPNFDEYASLVYKEAEQYGLMWAATAWSGQQNQHANEFEALSDWMAKFVGDISLFGAAFDLSKDYRDGNISFKPSPILGGFALAKMSFGHADELLSTIARWKLDKFRRRHSHSIQETTDSD